MPTPEDHVRRYLQFLTDPASLRDEAAIARAQEAVAQSNGDPIARVKALTALERAEAIDGEVFRLEFVANVGAWVEGSDVSVSSLVNYGVPEQDLVDAGLMEEAPKQRRKAKAAEPTRQRAPRIALEDVAGVLKKGKEYRLAEIAALIDREPPTARNYVNKLIDEGIVEVLGEDLNHAGKGKAPLLYGLA